jgi:hypothetical protein
MRFIPLRIAWSVSCFIACVLLGILWMESIKETQFFELLGVQMMGAGGRLLVDTHFELNETLPIGFNTVYWFAVPYSAMIWAATASGITPWLPRRLSRTTILVVVLLAVLFRFMVVSTFIVPHRW